MSKKIQQLQKTVTDAVFNSKKEISRVANSIDNVLINSVFLQDNFRIIDSYLTKHSWLYSPKSQIEILQDNLNEILTLRDSILKEIPILVEKSRENDVTLRNRLKNKNYKPQFIKLKSLYNNNSTYAMCLEFKRNDIEEYYSAYLFTHDSRNGFIQNFTKYDFSIESMTKDEFENDYIINRLSVMDFINGKDAIEYANYLRTIFNEQQLQQHVK